MEELYEKNVKIIVGGFERIPIKLHISDKAKLDVLYKAYMRRKEKKQVMRKIKRIIKLNDQKTKSK